MLSSKDVEVGRDFLWPGGWRGLAKGGSLLRGDFLWPMMQELGVGACEGGIPYKVIPYGL